TRQTRPSSRRWTRRWSRPRASSAGWDRPMPSILSSAASGMQHNATVLDIVGHNIANVSTDGFKAVRALAEGAPDAAAGEGRKGVAQTTLDRMFTAAAARPGAPLHF